MGKLLREIATLKSKKVKTGNSVAISLSAIDENKSPNINMLSPVINSNAIHSHAKSEHRWSRVMNPKHDSFNSMDQDDFSMLTVSFKRNIRDPFDTIFHIDTYKHEDEEKENDMSTYSLDRDWDVAYQKGMFWA